MNKRMTRIEVLEQRIKSLEQELERRNREIKALELAIEGLYGDRIEEAYGR